MITRMENFKKLGQERERVSFNAQYVYMNAFGVHACITHIYSYPKVWELTVDLSSKNERKIIKDLSKSTSSISIANQYIASFVILSQMHTSSCNVIVAFISFSKLPYTFFFSNCEAKTD